MTNVYELFLYFALLITDQIGQFCTFLVTNAMCQKLVYDPTSLDFLWMAWLMMTYKETLNYFLNTKIDKNFSDYLDGMLIYAVW